MKKRSLLLVLCAGLFGCPVTNQSVCEADGGSRMADGGSGSANTLQFRFVNLGREAVTVHLDGIDGGDRVQPLGSLFKTGHASSLPQRGLVEARTILPDGGATPVTLPFDFDGNADPAATIVLKETTSLSERISMNVTVGRQGPLAPFGERVRASLANVVLEGGIDVEGDCAADVGATAGLAAKVSLRSDTDQACDATADQYFARPVEVSALSTPYFIHGQDGQLQVAWVGDTDVLVSGPTRRLYVINAYLGARPASVDINGILLAQELQPGMMVRVKSNLVAKATQVAQSPTLLRIIVDGATQLLPLGTVLTGACRPPNMCDFANGEDTLVVVSENSPSSVSVLKADPVPFDSAVRKPIVLGATALVDTRACVSVLPNDDVCTMGAAQVTQASVGPIASATAYARFGRLLYAPKAVAGGTSLTFTVDEAGIAPRRFIWDNPAGLTPTPQADHVAGGFAIIAAGTSLDPLAINRKALYFIDTTQRPWRLQTSLSR